MEEKMRLAVIPVAAASLLMITLVGCGNDDAINNPGGTLPPIKTTTTLASSNTTVEPYFLHYKLKAGENMGMVARAFNVPLDVLIEYNKDRLGDNPSNLAIGTVIVIPPHRWIETLPSTTTTAAE